MFTTNIYIAKSFAAHLLMVFLICSGVILFFDTIELIRVMHSVSNTFLQIVAMAALKNYSHFQKIWLFVVLIASILTYYKFARNFELAAMRAMGLSVWQLLFPSICVAITTGIIHCAILSPVSASLMSRYQHLEAITLKGHKSLINLSKSGLWLKTYKEDCLEILHGKRLSQKNQGIFDFTIYRIAPNGHFIKRIDATTAIFKNSSWILTEAVITDSNYKKEMHKNLEIPTSITFAHIFSSLTPPTAISFWRLPYFIDLAQNSGFLALHYKLYFIQLLLSPLLLASIAFFGYNFGSQHTRYESHGKVIFIGICLGFIIYFLGDFASALSLSGTISILIAAPLSCILFALIGWYLILHNEFSL